MLCVRIYYCTVVPFILETRSAFPACLWDPALKCDIWNFHLSYFATCVGCSTATKRKCHLVIILHRNLGLASAEHQKMCGIHRTASDAILGTSHHIAMRICEGEIVETYGTESTAEMQWPTTCITESSILELVFDCAMDIWTYHTGLTT